MKMLLQCQIFFSLNKTQMHPNTFLPKSQSICTFDFLPRLVEPLHGEYENVI